MRPPDLETLLHDALDAEDWPEVDRLGALLDTRDQADHRRRAQVGLASAALWYAGQGLPVFPVRPGSKIPFARSHGCKEATTDRARVHAWWAEQPEANIGIATGHLVDVVDIDGPDGNESLAQIVEEMPTRLGWVSTPRPGGRHFYVPATGRGNTAAILPGIDYRGLGGYVVAPPSVTEQGSYRWVAPLDLDAVEAVA